MNRFRHYLAERLHFEGAPDAMLDMCGHTKNLYRYVAGLARDAGFSREAECPEVSCSDAGMDRLVHAEQVWFYRRLRAIGGDLSAGDPVTRELRREFEDEKPDESPKSAVRAWRK